MGLKGGEISSYHILFFSNSDASQPPLITTKMLFFMIFLNTVPLRVFSLFMLEKYPIRGPSGVVWGWPGLKNGFFFYVGNEIFGS